MENGVARDVLKEAQESLARRLKRKRRLIFYKGQTWMIHPQQIVQSL